MQTDPLQRVLAYHDRTKHQPGRYARSLGYLDWNTQPDPFRRFYGTALIPLDVTPPRATPAYDAIYHSGGLPARSLDRASISEFFYLSLAISAWKQAGDARWALRCNPSSGNLHPTEGYAILPAIDGLGDSPGVYHYAPREHLLEQRAVFGRQTGDRLAHCLPAASFLVGLSSVHWREAWKYGERAFRYCHHDVGHALAALRMAAAVLGWRLGVLEELGDADVAQVLGLNRTGDFEGAEPEHPDSLAVVFPGHVADVPRGLPREVIEQIAGSQWSGQANVLSSDHVDWDIINDVDAATIKPPTRVHVGSPRPETNAAQEPPAERQSAHRIIRGRRSAVAFDGTTRMSSDRFAAMLARTLPQGNAPPWDAIAWSPRVDLFLFVHLVDGLAPGLYAFIRDPARLAAIRASAKSDFPWSHPEQIPVSLPLYLLLEGDCRRLAAQLSLGQEIAGMSAASLAMVADFEGALERHGPWFYRRLYWEAGMIGQVLYLEAEASGIRSTGIGAYFDDLVHDILGFEDRRFQSMYHFTVGGPVEDTRLTTLPSYPAPVG